MKPSERVKELATQIRRAPVVFWGSLKEWLSVVDATCTAIELHLDEADERRAAFESDVLDRLAKLEAPAPDIGPPCAHGVAPHDMAGTGSCVRCGFTPKPRSVSESSYAHIARPDSLSRYGTGHPSELPCAKCGRPTWDLDTTAMNVDGKRYCSDVCYTTTKNPAYVGDGLPNVKAST